MSELDYDRLGQNLANRLLPKIVEDLAIEVRGRVADILKGDMEFLKQVRGPAGDMGEAGPRGENGPAGEKGQTGDTGAAGRDGPTVEELLTDKAFGGAIRMHVLDVMEKTARHRDERAEQAGKSLGPILVELFRHRRQVLHDKIAKTKGSDTQISAILQDHAKLLRGKLDYTIEPICRAIWYMRTDMPYIPEVMNGLGPHVDGMVQRYIVGLSEEIALNKNVRLDPGSCTEEITLLVRAIMGQIDQLGGP